MDRIDSWLATNLRQGKDYEPEAVHAALHRRGLTAAVVFPARNEEATVGDIVRSVRRDLVAAVPVFSEVVVIDSGSSDATTHVARDAGATVFSKGEVLPHVGDRHGKGEAMWKALAVVQSDIVVYCDADLVAFDSQLVLGLVGLLAMEPRARFVKACYDRPLTGLAGAHPTGGGRVTELLARPVINALFPQLAGFIQPLAGEYAAFRDDLLDLPFEGNYGVELGLLVELLHSVGLESMYQVDSGVREHTHSPTHELSEMASQILHVALRKAGLGDAVISDELMRFARSNEHFHASTVSTKAAPREPMRLWLSEHRS